MSRRSTLLYLLALVCFGTVCLGTCGCHSGTPTVNESFVRPETHREPAEVSQDAYIAWTNHTDGKVGEDLHPAPLPDGSAVVFSSSRHSQNHKLYLRTNSARTTRRLTHGSGDDLHAAVSPEGQRIVFSSNRAGGWHLYLLEGLEQPVVHRLGTDDADALHPSWSPDGQSVTYSRRSPASGEWEVWIYELETSQSRYLVEGLFPSFHPNGHSIAFQRHRKRDAHWYSIWTVDKDGTHEREIVSGKDWGAVNPSWSPRGTEIAFNTVSKSSGNHDPSDADLYVIRADGTNLTRITSANGPEWNPTWGRDGRIYFNATVEGSTAVWSMAR